MRRVAYKRTAFALIGLMTLLGASTIVRADARVSSDELAAVCVPKTGGPIRVPGPGQGCTPSETSKMWVVGGEITEIRPGEGLVGGGTEGSVSIGVDPSLFPESGDQIIAGFNDGPGPIEPSEGSIGGVLDLPAGRYAIFAKLWVSAPWNRDTQVNCMLRTSGADFDETEVFLSHREEAPDPSGSMSFMVVHKFRDPGKVAVACFDVDHFHGGTSFGDAVWHDLKIVAIMTSHLSNVFLGS